MTSLFGWDQTLVPRLCHLNLVFLSTLYSVLYLVTSHHTSILPFSSLKCLNCWWKAMQSVFVNIQPESLAQICTSEICWNTEVFLGDCFYWCTMYRHYLTSYSTKTTNNNTIWHIFFNQWTLFAHIRTVCFVKPMYNNVHMLHTNVPVRLLKTPTGINKLRTAYNQTVHRSSQKQQKAMCRAAAPVCHLLYCTVHGGPEKATLYCSINYIITQH